MDNLPRGADDLPDEVELSGPVRDAIEQIRRDEPSDAMLARALQRAKQIPAAPQSNASSLPPDKRATDKFPFENDLPAPRRHRMFTLAIRALAAATAATALI